jgi:hypothetical protein
MAAGLLTAFLVTVFVLVRWWFQGGRHKPITRTERTVAMAWLIIRRVVCFFAALVSFALACLVVFQMVGTASVSALSIFGLVLACTFGFFFVHLGMYGTGHSRYNWTEDKAVHDARRKRYGWRW